jgi:hypothetical protein
VRPYWKDLYLYREAANQWYQLMATDENGESSTSVSGVQGGVITPSLDDPLDPWEWSGRSDASLSLGFPKDDEGIRSIFSNNKAMLTDQKS